ncbi:MAG TPA: hypothetical protein VNS63_22675 [Blastocatellia bacterium]|nr:hypothetical protein [Blastocatellia bacterium]
MRSRRTGLRLDPTGVIDSAGGSSSRSPSISKETNERVVTSQPLLMLELPTRVTI